jgi:hypothetical protein
MVGIVLMVGLEHIVLECVEQVAAVECVELVVVECVEQVVAELEVVELAVDCTLVDKDNILVVPAYKLEVHCW